MSHPYSPTDTSQPSKPFALWRRRTLMACSNCRRLKIKCKPPDETRRAPCERCARRGTACEYISVINQQEREQAGSRASAGPSVASSSSHSRHPTPPPPVNKNPREQEEEAGLGAAAPDTTRLGSRRGHQSAAPSLPYTEPPPFGVRPRYSGQPFPDLRLSTTQSEHPLPSSSQRLTHAQYSGSVIPAWSGSTSMPEPFTSGAMRIPPSRYYPHTHNTTPQANPAFAPHPAMHQGYHTGF
ncbi:hypothetical protein FB451DRAFT_1478837 [Mycena latifolia]|nr:hypothetical protein FB451DRAFT_1478837 [Mycena latifolia]